MLTIPLMAIINRGYGVDAYPNPLLPILVFIAAFTVHYNWQFALIWAIGFSAFRMPSLSGNGFRIWVPTAEWRRGKSDEWIVRIVEKLGNKPWVYWVFRPWAIYITYALAGGNLLFLPLCAVVGLCYIVCPPLKLHPHHAELLSGAAVGGLMWLSYGV